MCTGCIYSVNRLGMALFIQLCVASFVIFESRQIFPSKLMDYINYTNRSLATNKGTRFTLWPPSGTDALLCVCVS